VALQVPYAVADYWRREAKQARMEREFWVLMTWQLAGLLLAIAFRRYHMHLWESFPITGAWFVSLFALKIRRERRERKRDEWTRRHV